MKRSSSPSSSPNTPQVLTKRQRKTPLVSETKTIPEAEESGDDQVGVVVDAQWERVEKRKAKKKKKLDTKLDVNPPRFLYSNPEIKKRKEAVGISDVRDLVLHIIADTPPPSWIRVQNQPNIQKLVVLLVPGLTSTVLSLPPLPTSATENPNLPIPIPLPSDSPPSTQPAPSDLPSSIDPRSEEAAALYGGVPFIARTFSHACPTFAPGDTIRMHSVLNTFFQAPVSGEEKKRRLQERIAAERTGNKDPSQYLLTVEQMIENDYPIPSYLADVFEKPDSWIETPQVAPNAGSSPPPLYAIDCEMCLTEEGKALTRVCIIEFVTSKVVFDKLVKPPSPITDYLTRFSGITEAALEDVTTTLADVQDYLRTLITPSTILLGHSLESDLRALQLSHPHCIDTALLFHHPRGRPLKPGLAWLTRRWLGRTIQDRGPGGHDPEEDARACVDLLKAKLKNGPGYGEFRTDYEPIIARITRSHSRLRGPGGGGARVAIVDHGNPGVWHGTSAAAPATTVSCTNDAEVVDGVLRVLDAHEFVFARLMGLADALGWVTPKVGVDAIPPEVPDNSSSAAAAAENANHTNTPPPLSSPGNVLFNAVKDLNAHLTTLHAALSPRTAFLILSGHSDPRSMSALAARRAEYQTANQKNQNSSSLSSTATATAAGTDDSSAQSPRWSTADDRALEEAVIRARMGLLFVGIKA
ncbi:hypothetical protein B0F90DRAFT_1670908 [Multifurca ochricompacta]|uniref:Exonuclease domain-containing protein n=1 Tax=Multifurca ochricompacta TaxID=376703 RepID=A0AAD4LYU6_9AGAM|nr:hypothetical protein B0F90DRAFT_1670908 [Multifurca ochricompacta]